MTVLEYLPIVVAAAAVGLDVVSFPQMMVSRPLVAATIGGALAGRVGSGLLVGVVLELLALDTLPVGASRYPEWGSAAVVAGALAAAFDERTPAAVPVAALLGLLAALLGGWSMIQLRRLNAHWAHGARDALAAGSGRAVVGLQLAGLTADLVRGAAVATAALVVGVPLLALVTRSWTLDARSSAAVAAAGPAAVAAAALWKRAAAAGDARWYVAAGLAIGAAIAWLR